MSQPRNAAGFKMLPGGKTWIDREGLPACVETTRMDAAVQAERERCAKIAEDCLTPQDNWGNRRKAIAAAIRSGADGERCIICQNVCITFRFLDDITAICTACDPRANFLDIVP